jgi:hypothetical protein
LQPCTANAQAGRPARKRAAPAPRREAAELLHRATSRWHLSARAYERTLSDHAHHVAEGLQDRLQRG